MKTALLMFLFACTVIEAPKQIKACWNEGKARWKVYAVFLSVFYSFGILYIWENL